jgi:protein MpaA
VQSIRPSTQVNLRPRHQRGPLTLEPQTFGRSVLGTALEYWPQSADRCDLLLLAGQHGEEPDCTVILSRALRALPQAAENVATVLALNPDGLSRGTRGNANGVDLNRNFPTANWSTEPTSYRWNHDAEPPDDRIFLSTGSAPSSEPETQALIDLVEKLQPTQIVALHGPLACIDDPDQSPLGKWLAEQTGMPLVTDIGYPTPGSFGTWCAEQYIPIITWEFPHQPIEQLTRDYLPILETLLLGRTPISQLLSPSS